MTAVQPWNEAGKKKTCQRFNDPGHAHSLTFCCFRRQAFLLRDRCRTWLVDAINLARQKHRLDVWAYVFMPEHVHLLVFPSRDDGYSISAVLSTIKQSVSKRAILYVRAHAPEFLSKMTEVQPNGNQHLRFWQRGGGFDRNLWSPKLIWETIDYIHANPVRRGLCPSPEDWAWSSARTFRDRSGGLIPIGFDSLPEDNRRKR